MKTPHLLLFAGTLFASSSLSSLALNITADGIFVDGVSLKSGWFDVNKAYLPMFCHSYSNGQYYKDAEATARYFPNSDRLLCWAASASNIIEYMNASVGNPLVYSSTYGTETGILANRIDAVNQYASYELFTSNSLDQTSNVAKALAWYTTGSSAFGDGSTIPLRDGANPGGFYQDTIGTTTSDFRSNVMASHYQFIGTDHVGEFVSVTNLTGYADLFEIALESGPIALTIATLNGAGRPISNAHVITCWGYNEDASGNLESIYITDSDDGEERIRELTVSLNSGHMLLDEEEKDFIYLYDENGNLLTNQHGYWKTYDNEGSNSDYYIADLMSFKNFVKAIPEPSMFGCFAGLFALSLAMIRRKRKTPQNSRL